MTAPMPLGPPRLLPMEALFLLGTYSHEDGFVEFVLGLREDGFALWSPEDEELSLDEWEDVANRRVRTLVTSWEIYVERLAASTDESRDADG